MPTNLFLTIIHNIFLTEKQRYDLIRDKEMEVVGVSVPVWYMDNNSSEPANEVFCKYNIKCVDGDVFVRYFNNNFNVQLSLKGNLSVNSLKNYKDGGVESLGFRYPGRIKNKNKYIKVYHLVEIKDMEELTNTV